MSDQLNRREFLGAVGAGMKYYSRNMYTCCSGTYFQDVVEYQNLIYFQDDAGLYVNLYLPSTVEWSYSGRTVKLTQATSYPEAETIAVRVDATSPVTFPLKFHVPAWSSDVSLRINGSAANVTARPGEWGATTSCPSTCSVSWSGTACTSIRPCAPISGNLG